MAPGGSKSGVVKPGDLVVYRNTNRIPKPLLGIVLYEHSGIAVDNRFYQILLQSGESKMIADHYLREVEDG